jgi:hypothetical protein
MGRRLPWCRAAACERDQLYRALRGDRVHVSGARGFAF